MTPPRAPEPPPVTISRGLVDHLAHLAALSLTEDEANAMARELAKIVAFVDELSEVDTTDVAGAAAAAPRAAWREDVVVAGLSQEEALGGAPRVADGGFAVPGFVSATPGTGTP